MAEFAQLDPAEETQFLPGSEDAGYGYGQEEAVFLPYYGLASLGGGPGPVGSFGDRTVRQTITYDSVPLGEVEVRRGEPVRATDGDIGRVQGLVIDPGNHHVTHVLLQEGHLWGRKEVAIPITAVSGVADGIRLKISKQQVQELPPVDIDHPGGRPPG
jgi:sporulation protein YlmC with PRC-barrel domain